MASLIKIEISDPENPSVLSARFYISSGFNCTPAFFADMLIKYALASLSGRGMYILLWNLSKLNKTFL